MLPAEPFNQRRPNLNPLDSGGSGSSSEGVRLAAMEVSTVNRCSDDADYFIPMIFT